ncbi:aspartate carbamoyltransferase [Streptomyces sp. UC4497]
MRTLTSPPRHAASLAEWTEDDYEALFERATWLESQPRDVASRLAPGLLVGTAFYQNSTRTRLSFEAAAHRIGGSAIGFADVTTTRAGDFYRETLEDTVRVLGSYVDVLVLRHTDDAAAEQALQVSPVPVISAGTGDREHPTQVMLDLWTLRQELGSLRGATIGYLGDPGCRVARSLVYALDALRAEGLVFLAPEGATLPKDVADLIDERGLLRRHVETGEELLRLSDAVCAIPFELSDFHQGAVRDHGRGASLDERYVLSARLLRTVGADVPVTHTGPRGPELPPETHELANTHYFDGVGRGVTLRAALLAGLT